VPKNDVTKLMLFPLVEWLRMGRAEFARLLRGVGWRPVRSTLAGGDRGVPPVFQTAFDIERQKP
jgi:hypothetical protein